MSTLKPNPPVGPAVGGKRRSTLAEKIQSYSPGPASNKTRRTVRANTTNVTMSTESLEDSRSDLKSGNNISQRTASASAVFPSSWSGAAAASAASKAHAYEKMVESSQTLNMDSASSSTSSLNPNTLFESQQIMPAPGQTYFQIAVEKKRVILRDWPRQRLSQKWTRDGNLNPGQLVISLKDFVDGELKEKIVWIFGEEVYENALAAAREALELLDA
ncbi:hypothetical protein HDU76_011367 [Blyttiomyces sp. JEL0837]|nr:hypothetical protein HDU76_011367 [Blyttiomyces sp. JEL0837]